MTLPKRTLSVAPMLDWTEQIVFMRVTRRFDANLMHKKIKFCRELSVQLIKEVKKSPVQTGQLKSSKVTLMIV